MSKTLEEFALLEPLWDKAIQFPSDVSLEEKHRMMEWPPLEEMQANAKRFLGISLEDLLQKAVTNAESLTYAECRLVRDQFRIKRMIEMGDGWNRSQWSRKCPNLFTKRFQAQEAILTANELKAVQAVDEIFYRKQNEELEAREAERQKKPPQDMPQEWVQNIIDREGDKSWGCVFYHQKTMAGWNEFMELFSAVLEMPHFCPGYEEIQDHKFAQFIPFETEKNDLILLQQDFRNRRERDDLKPGVLKNVLFLVTDEARLSCGTAHECSQIFWGYLWAIDPDWPLSEVDKDGYNGRLKIHINFIFFRFYEFMSMEFSLKDLWLDFQYVKSNNLYPGVDMDSWGLTHLDKPKWPFN
ncbi:uncharacterized protein N7469_009416 [Penicillium citrinum]|uniref:Uncharacterized protein n=2 Tax=Penicillium TaxID=5073 RepID=A0A9W9THQ4_PENCI|nr:uncharacterized protein N7469_009416 [Penicillium citrinum]KAJ5223176.1 hypothetical protein N7469_009416 [Penicillium citrinum]